MKDTKTAYVYCALGLIGIGGLQRLYLGKTGTGLLYLFTFGLFGVGQLVDAFQIPDMVEEYNEQKLEARERARLRRGDFRALPSHRIPRNSEEFQVALVQAAGRCGGRLTTAEAVTHTGRGYGEVKRQLDQMAVEGYIELDSDDEGNEYYHFPGL